MAPRSTSGVVRNALKCASCRSGRQPDRERTEYDAHLYALDLGPAEALSAAMVLDAALAPLRCGVRVMHSPNRQACICRAGASAARLLRALHCSSGNKRWVWVCYRRLWCSLY